MFSYSFEKLRPRFSRYVSKFAEDGKRSSQRRCRRNNPAPLVSLRHDAAPLTRRFPALSFAAAFRASGRAAAASRPPGEHLPDGACCLPKPALTEPPRDCFSLLVMDLSPHSVGLPKDSGDTNQPGDVLYNPAPIQTNPHGWKHKPQVEMCPPDYQSSHRQIMQTGGMKKSTNKDYRACWGVTGTSTTFCS